MNLFLETTILVGRVASQNVVIELLMFDNRFDKRMDVCLHDTAGCQTGCTTV